MRRLGPGVPAGRAHGRRRTSSTLAMSLTSSRTPKSGLPRCARLGLVPAGPGGARHRCRWRGGARNPVEFGDGVLTGRGTFQKLYEQAELWSYLETQLRTEAIPAGIGTFYIFKDEGQRQQFLANRFRRREILPRRRIAELRLEETRAGPGAADGGHRCSGPGSGPGTSSRAPQRWSSAFGSLKRAFAAIRRSRTRRPGKRSPGGAARTCWCTSP